MKKIPHTFKLSSEATRMLTELSKGKAVGKTSLIETWIRDQYTKDRKEKGVMVTPYMLECIKSGIEPCPRCGDPLEGEHLNCPPLREGEAEYMRLWEIYHPVARCYHCDSPLTGESDGGNFCRKCLDAPTGAPSGWICRDCGTGLSGPDDDHDCSYDREGE